MHKLIAEAIADLEIQDNAVILSPVGCSVFAYYYFDACGISVPHGRAPAVGTGISRANPHSLVISYQGDGDLGAIGFNNFIQSANRGEDLTVIFMNNAIYGMTGGQMAPTTLPGQKTTTSPYGRSTLNEGYPLKVSEMVAALDSPIYVERVALTSTAKIMKARKALRRALKYQKEKRGFSLLEVLSGCPVNLKMSPKKTDEWIENNMIPYFPLGCLKDIGSDRDPIKRPIGIYDKGKVKEVLWDKKFGNEKHPDFKNESAVFTNERRIKCAGFGGQGVLSLGMMIASMGQLRNFNVTWLPSYGPEMRGGTANCSVVLSRKQVGSPIIDKDINLLIVMNQPSMDKFLPELKENGLLLYDSSIIAAPECTSDKQIFSIKASDIAGGLGSIKYANSVILGALSVALHGYLEKDDKADFDKVFEEAIIKCFVNKKNVVQANIKAFHEGKAEVIREQ
jgi:2-oxoisovalerate ferredoxin oxidoreductase beta subunit